MATSYIYNELTGEFEEREIIPPRIKYFRLRNRKAFLDKPCTIEWEVEYASSVSLDRVGPQNATGFFTYRPNGNSHWVLRARGEGELTQTLEVEAYPLPKINSFTAQPEKEGWSFIVGDKITLHWNAEHYDNLEINGEDVFGEDSKVIELLDETNEFVLTARCDEQAVSETLQIQAHKRPVINFSANRDKLRLGHNEACVLSWNTENVQSIALYENGEKIDIPSNGSSKVIPSVTTKYKIIAIACDGSRKYESQIIISVIPEADITFVASREFTLPHIPIQLSWEIKHGHSAKLIGDFDGAGDVALSGNKTIVLEKKQTIKLQVEDDFGITESSINIRMLPIPVIREIMTPTPSLNRRLEISAYVSRPCLHSSLPHYSTIRTIPFVPIMQIPELSMKSPMVNLVKKIPKESITSKGWNILNEITASLCLFRNSE